MTYTLRTSLYTHQKNMIEWAEERKCGIIAADMGVGKSLVALELFRRNPIKTVYVCPKAVASHIHKQYQTHLNSPVGSCFIYLGPSRNSCLNQRRFEEARFIITTYNMLVQELGSETSILFNTIWEQIFLDEAHCIRNANTLRYKSCITLKTTNDCKRWCITGTPVLNKKTDIISLSKFLKKEPYTTPNWWRAVTEEKLKMWRQDCCIYVSKELACKLPAKIIKTVYCELLPDQQIVYDAMCVSAIDIVKKYLSKEINFFSVLTIITRLKQVAIHPLIPTGTDDSAEIPDSNKFVKAKELINATPKDDKVIVFSQYTFALKLLSKYLSPDIKSLTFTGDLSSAKRNKILDDFRSDESVKVLFISLLAGGVGLDIVEANHVIFLDPWWNSAIQDQAIDRAHRIGQKKTVYVHQLHSSGTLENWIQILQKSKYALSKQLINASTKEGPSKEDIKILYETHLKEVKLDGDYKGLIKYGKSIEFWQNNKEDLCIEAFKPARIDRRIDEYGLEEALS